MTVKVNYTAEMEQKLVQMYADLEYDNEKLHVIAEALDKPVKSVRSKLALMGKYVATDKSATPRATGPSKKEILRDLDLMGFDSKGFDPATKDALFRLFSFVKENTQQ